MSDALEVFSGNVPMGVCGTPTGFVDMSGKALHVGDIVLTFTTRNGSGIDYWPDRLTAVVDRGNELANAGERYFVMGIACVSLDEPDEWRVIKVKGFDEVIPGEHWKAWGFSYRESVAAPQ